MTYTTTKPKSSPIFEDSRTFYEDNVCIFEDLRRLREADTGSESCDAVGSPMAVTARWWTARADNARYMRDCEDVWPPSMVRETSIAPTARSSHPIGVKKSKDARGRDRLGPLVRDAANFE